MILGTSKILTKSGPVDPVFITKIFKKIQEKYGNILENIIFSYLDILKIQNSDIFGPTQPRFFSYFEIPPKKIVICKGISWTFSWNNSWRPIIFAKCKTISKSYWNKNIFEKVWPIFGWCLIRVETWYYDQIFFLNLLDSQETTNPLKICCLEHWGKIRHQTVHHRNAVNVGERASEVAGTSYIGLKTSFGRMFLGVHLADFQMSGRLICFLFISKHGSLNRVGKEWWNLLCIGCLFGARTFDLRVLSGYLRLGKTKKLRVGGLLC